MTGIRFENFSLTGKQSKSDLVSTPFLRTPRTTPTTTPFVTPGTNTDLIPRITTTTIPSLRVPTEITRDPPIARMRFPDFDFMKGPSNKKRKGKGGRVQKRAFKATDPLAAVLGPRFRLGRRVQSISDLLD